MNNLSVKCIKSETLETGSCYSKFVINSLKPGQGITIGNQLRRVLLGDLGKKAIYSVRIVGINHEFSIIPGVREDVLEIFLNLKGVIIKSNSKEPEFGRLKVHGPTVITADLIKLKNNSTIVNKNHYIATISSPTIFECEFKIKYDTGYKLASHVYNEEDKNFIEIDAIFMPVQQVDFKIENVYDKNNNFKERLFLEIWTDGSILPINALRSAGKIIINLFTSLIKQESILEEPKNKVESKDIVDFESYTNIPIEDLQLSVRSYNCLKKAQIRTVGGLLQYSLNQLLELKNFGQKSANEVASVLKIRFGIIYQ